MNRLAIRGAGAWRPVQRGGRRPVVTCIECGESAINESNHLVREGWLESIGNGERLFLCGECAAERST